MTRLRRILRTALWALRNWRAILVAAEILLNELNDEKARLPAPGKGLQ